MPGAGTRYRHFQNGDPSRLSGCRAERMDSISDIRISLELEAATPNDRPEYFSGGAQHYKVGIGAGDQGSMTAGQSHRLRRI